MSHDDTSKNCEVLGLNFTDEMPSSGGWFSLNSFEPVICKHAAARCGGQHPGRSREDPGDPGDPGGGVDGASAHAHTRSTAEPQPPPATQTRTPPSPRPPRPGPAAPEAPGKPKEGEREPRRRPQTPEKKTPLPWTLQTNNSATLGAHRRRPVSLSPKHSRAKRRRRRGSRNVVLLLAAFKSQRLALGRRLVRPRVRGGAIQPISSGAKANGDFSDHVVSFSSPFPALHLRRPGAECWAARLKTTIPRKHRAEAAFTPAAVRVLHAGSSSPAESTPTGPLNRRREKDLSTVLASLSSPLISSI